MNSSLVLLNCQSLLVQEATGFGGWVENSAEPPKNGARDDHLGSGAPTSAQDHTAARRRRYARLSAPQARARHPRAPASPAKPPPPSSTSPPRAPSCATSTPPISRRSSRATSTASSPAPSPPSPIPAARLALAGKVLTLLATETADATFHEQNLAPPPRILGSVYLTAPPRRPSTPLTTSTLLTRNRFEPTLAHEITCEVDSADSVDLLAAFITVGGVRSVRDALESLARRGARLRVLTTVFTGTTEIAALDTLARLPGAEVRISFDTRRTRLHAKAWLFQRDVLGAACEEEGSRGLPTGGPAGQGGRAPTLARHRSRCAIRESRI